jgi:threonine dehydrogenase-like Zn-dependent dehydrogenase
VYGAGVLGLLSVAVLHKLYPTFHIFIIARYPHQVELAHKLGADHILCTRDAIEIVVQIAEMVGARIHHPWRGLPWLLGGVDVIYDTLGTAESLKFGIRIAKSHAPVVITGVGMSNRFEWTPHYFKEIKLIGSNAFVV